MSASMEGFKSAYLGDAPLSSADKILMRGLQIISPSQFNPNKTLVYGPPRPVGYVFEDRSTGMIIGQAWAIFFVLLFTTARLYMRGIRSRTWGLDDHVIIPGAVGCLAYLGLVIASETKGCMGKHIFDCTYDTAAWFIMIGEIQQPVFYFSVFCTKLSIALATRRMTGTHSPRWRVAHWIFIGLLLALLPTCTLLNAFQCLPVPANYSLWYVGGLADPRQVTCLNRTAVTLSTRALHMLTDILVFCVPIVIVARLQLSRARRLRLAAVFAVGGTSVLASVVRIAVLFRYTDDMTWDGYHLYAFNVIDITFAAVVASLPALNAALESALKRARDYIAQRSSSRGLSSRTRGYFTRSWRSRGGKSAGGERGAATDEHRSSEETKYSEADRNIRVLRGYEVTKEERPERPYILSLGQGMTDASVQSTTRHGSDDKPMWMI